MREDVIEMEAESIERKDVGRSVLDLIGNTPLVRIRNLNPVEGVEIYAKLEGMNPGGSIKDRVALAMVERAEKQGELQGDRIIIEATSGNTGIGLAMVCAVKGYRLMLLMPESASEERKMIMRAYGAQIKLTPGHLSTDGAIEEAYRLAREEPQRYVLMDQFNNPASIDAHYYGTALEIWQQTGGRVTHVVAALGTSGTAMGLSKRLKELNGAVKVVAVEPYVGHSIQGLKNMQASYPPGIYNKRMLDEIIHIDDETAFEMCRRLAREEGIFAGMSSGAALAGAIKLAQTLKKGLIVVIFPDGGERYLSTSLFAMPKARGISLFNIKTRKKDFLPGEEKVLIFSPGPSAEEVGEVEVWRRLVLADVLAGYISLREIEGEVIIGVADFDDQALLRAEDQGCTLQQFSMRLIAELKEMAQFLMAHHLTFYRASENIPFMVEMCQRLLDRGKGYEKLRSVYYDVFRDREYGKMVGADLEKLELGKTVDFEDYAKDNPRDFTLLKRSSLRDLKRGEFIKTRWGNVRPSWYLQMAGCAGEKASRVEVVIFGRNHYFPHLENIRSIWRYSLSHDPRIWMLVQGVVSEKGEDMPSLKELISTYGAHVVRMWLLSSSYHKPLVYSEKNLKMWEQNFKRVERCVINLGTIRGEEGEVRTELKQKIFDLKKAFSSFMEDDLRIYKFWASLFELCKRVNSLFSRKGLSRAEAEFIWEKLTPIQKVLKIVDLQSLPLGPEDIPPEIREKVSHRERLKSRGEYSRADEIRTSLLEKGYLLEDTPYGVRVFKRKDLVG